MKKNVLVSLIVLSIVTTFHDATANDTNQAEASITLGTQFVREAPEGVKVKWYVREIYLTAPPPYEFWGMTLSGFKPTRLRSRLERSDLESTKDGVLMFIHEDPRPIPLRVVALGKGDPDSVLVASAYISGYTTYLKYSNPVRPMKITVAIPFFCRPEYGPTA